MTDRRHRLKRLVLALVIYATFPVAWFIRPIVGRNNITICFFRTVTGRPCPFCGLTRAFAFAIHGEFGEAFHYHPLWWVAALVVACVGFVCLLDAVTGSDLLGILRRSCPLGKWFVVIVVLVALLLVLLR